MTVTLDSDQLDFETHNWRFYIDEGADELVVEHKASSTELRFNSAGEFDGVDVSAHSSRHGPGGSDELIDQGVDTTDDVVHNTVKSSVRQPFPKYATIDDVPASLEEADVAWVQDVNRFVYDDGN